MRLGKCVLGAAVATANLAVLCCAHAPDDEMLPSPKVPVRFTSACYPPTPGDEPEGPPPPLPPPLAAPESALCVKDRSRSDKYEVVLQVDGRGAVVAAFVREDRSVSVDSCILERVRKIGWQFSPGRDCLGEPVASEVLIPYRALYPAPIDLGREVAVPAAE